MNAQGSTVARNYAETLLVLAGKAGEPAAWGAMLRQVAEAVDSDVRLSRFLESPRIPAAAKLSVFQKALGDRVPALMLRFLQTLVRNRRQALLPQISAQYDSLLDASENRVHARLTFAQAPADQDTSDIAARLSSVLGKTVVPHVVVDPAIMGGVVVRVGDTIMDGSVRRRLQLMRKKMAGASR
jgi:F-type H+-transporting ATPase subunit delta